MSFGSDDDVHLIADRLLAIYRTAAATVSAYRTLLAEQHVDPDAITDTASFSRLAPVLSKANTFERFSIDQLSTPGSVTDIADVLTSSGRGGRFSFGLTTRSQAAATVAFLDDALDDAFHVKSRTTLAINCLPMGVVFTSNVMTLATTSVREDMAVALVEAFGRGYEQVLLVGDPLFLKRLTDYAREARVDWAGHRMNAIVGEEIFGEFYREYLSTSLGTDVDTSERGYVMSSFGIGELGLHLGYETPSTIRLRRAALRDADFARDLFGTDVSAGAPLPMLFAFDPHRIFLEILDPDAAGYGKMTVSMLDAGRRIPLLRYQAGDIAARVDGERAGSLALAKGITLPSPLPHALFALQGRSTEVLPNGSHVATYKDALYRDPAAARCVTGAVRLIVNDGECTMHVQLTREAGPSLALEQTITNSVPSEARPTDVVLWPYHQFPFAMTLDYERKFTYYVPNESAPDRLPLES